MRTGGLRVSICIPTYNRHGVLLDAIHGALMQSYAPMEVIVYDQTPVHPPPVQKELDLLSRDIRYVKGRAQGLVAAYRKCVEIAQGNVCLFIDDDVLIGDKLLLQKHLRHYHDDGVGAVSGQVLHEGQKSGRKLDPRTLGPHGWMFIRFDTNRLIGDAPSLFGPNMSFSRRLYQRVDGFDSNFRGNGFRFETDFSFKIKRFGRRVVFDPEASLVHRYHTPGGAENRHLMSMHPESLHWYHQFFANTWYFLRKWHRLPVAAALMTKVWRAHALNRAAYAAGPAMFLKRQRVIVSGMLDAEGDLKRKG